jgi:hypothetical protein
VNRRRSIVCVVAACLGAALGPACAAKKDRFTPVLPASETLDWRGDACTQERLDKFVTQSPQDNCRPKIHPDEGILRGSLDGDFRYFRIHFDRSVPKRHREVFHAAMGMWNRQSHVTGFVFDDEPSAKAADFRVTRGLPSPPPNAGADQPTEMTICSGFRTDKSSIWYSQNTFHWVKTDADVAAAARIFAHELGHGLNIDHKTSSSVMRQGNPETYCDVLARSMLMDVQEYDARDAFRCGCGIRLKPRKGVPKPVPDRK